MKHNIESPNGTRVLKAIAFVGSGVAIWGFSCAAASIWLKFDLFTYLTPYLQDAVANLWAFFT